MGNVDKDFTYQIIGLLREDGETIDNRSVMRGAANVMESNIRAYLDLEAKNAELVAENLAYKEGIAKLWDAYRDFFDAFMKAKDWADRLAVIADALASELE
jgi:hypothetical protein